MDFYKIEDGFSTITLNPKLFSLDVAYSAAYTLLDKAFVTFDGDPETEILVKLSFKDETKNTADNLKEISKEFHNNLVNENANRLGSNRKEYLRALLLKKSFTEINLEALDESLQDSTVSDGEKEESKDEIFTDDDFDDDLDDDFEFDDPEGIAVPWDEKFSEEDTSSKVDNANAQSDAATENDTDKEKSVDSTANDTNPNGP